jgi:recombination protein U
MGAANRGKAFEDLINYAIDMEQRKSGGALAFKVPTAWKVQRRYNPYTRKNEIASAFPEKKSIVDYMGIYRGRAFAFEAKSTENKRLFPLSNIELHQLEFLSEWQQRGGISFFLIHFTSHNRTFFVHYDQIAQYQQSGGRSLPLEWFDTNSIELIDPLRLFQELADKNLL